MPEIARPRQMSSEIKHKHSPEPEPPIPSPSDKAGKKADEPQTPASDQALALLLLGLAHEGVRLGPQNPSLLHKKFELPVRRTNPPAAQPSHRPRSFTASRHSGLISMDTHYNASLVYHQHPGTASFPDPVSLYPSNPHEMSWQTNHSPPNSSSSPDHPMYNSMSRSQDHPDYDPQPSPTYIQSRHPLPSPTHHPYQPHHMRESARDGAYGTDASMGQNRMFTRPARRDSRLADEGQREAGPSSAPSDHYDSRGSPARRPSLRGPFVEHTDGPSSAAIADGQYSRPAGVFPLTPVSTSYTFYPSHSRSASGSGSGSGSATTSAGNARSASPALSVASALTSVSSSASAQKYTDNHPHATGHSVSGAAPAAPRPKHRKQRLYNVDRKKICVYHRDHPNVKQEEIARLFGVERSTISKILKQKMKWLAVPEETPVLLARTRPTKFPILELRLEKWLRECHEAKIIFTDALIRDKAKEIARSMDWPDDKFKASSGWVENFKHRHGIRKGIWNGYGQRYSQAVANGGDPTSSIPYFDLDPTSHYTNGKPAFAQPDDPVPQSEMDHEMGLDSEEEDELHDDRHPEHGITLQPAWQPPPPPPPLPSGTISHTHDVHHHVAQAPPEDHSPMHEVAPVADPHEPLPAPLPMPEPVAIPLHPDSDTNDPTEVAYVIPVLPTYRPDPGIPTVDEVEDAIDKVLAFVDAQEKDFLSESDRDALTAVKCALFSRAGGIPYQRDAR